MVNEARHYVSLTPWAALFSYWGYFFVGDWR